MTGKVEAENFTIQKKDNARRLQRTETSTPCFSSSNISSCDESTKQLLKATKIPQSRSSEMLDKSVFTSPSLYKAISFHRILKDVNSSTKKLEEETNELLGDLVRL